jgi:hypothetical protein
LTDQRPAADPERRSRSSRAQDSARRRTIARRRIAVAVGGVAVVVIAVILLTGGEVPLIDGPDGPSGFGFQLGKVQATPITRTPPPELHDAAQEAGAGVKETMDELYFRAFVDQDSWGDYGAAFELFEDGAAARAESDQEVLTLGSTAADEFESIEAPSGSLTISVLTDQQDAPVSAVANVQFEATVQTEGGGTSTQVVSVGSFFLRQVEGAWRIFAYDVDRNDVETSAPSPTGSPS